MKQHLDLVLYSFVILKIPDCILSTIFTRGGKSGSWFLQNIKHHSKTKWWQPIVDKQNLAPNSYDILDSIFLATWLYCGVSTISRQCNQVDKVMSMSSNSSSHWKTRRRINQPTMKPRAVLWEWNLLWQDILLLKKALLHWTNYSVSYHHLSQSTSPLTQASRIASQSQFTCILNIYLLIIYLKTVKHKIYLAWKVI